MSLYFETSNDSLKKYGEELCGDSVDIVKKNGSIVMVLSDGLGSGVRANILSSLTTKIVSTMLLEGAEIQEVVETLAATLPICKDNLVAYSTFSFIKIDKFGEAHIIEFDNPEIIILRKGKALEIKRKESIIDGKKIREAHMKLRKDDFIFLYSDGVLDAGTDFPTEVEIQHKNLCTYIENTYKKEATSFYMQTLLLNACKNLYKDTPKDDTTVAVCRVREAQKAYIMIGPPKSTNDDEKVVARLLDYEGPKVVCGGTTAQIVSKLSNKELTATINYITPEIPPVGFMEGIDLVTEGVITLGKVYEIMKNYEDSTVDRESHIENKQDGASLLAYFLINKCTGAKFMVGKAVNPVYDDLDTHIDSSYKFELVEQIVECMKKLGKDVEIEYY